MENIQEYFQGNSECFISTFLDSWCKKFTNLAETTSYIAYFSLQEALNCPFEEICSLDENNKERTEGDDYDSLKQDEDDEEENRHDGMDETDDSDNDEDDEDEDDDDE